MHEHIPRALAQKMAATNAEIIGLDAIRLIESGLGAICDATVAVTAPEEVRVKRIMARDSITEEYARSRIAAQKDADYFRAQCDYEFVNDLPTAEKGGTRGRGLYQHDHQQFEGGNWREMSEKNKLVEKLLYAPKNGYDRLSAEDEKAMEAYCDHKKFSTTARLSAFAWSTASSWRKRRASRPTKRV